jgi:pimeloyl-ACP methyl ester carboxylesterase
MSFWNKTCFNRRVQIKPESMKKNPSDIAPPSKLLLGLEGRAFLEWSAVGLTLPLMRLASKGDGHPVLVIPGLGAGDSSTWPLRHSLEKLGYDVHAWELGSNFGPRGNTVTKLLARVRHIARTGGAPMSIVGWSLGGAMARAVAVRMPQHVRSVITLGSPLGPYPKATNAWRIFELVSGMKVDHPAMKKLLTEVSPVPMTSILSKSDGIVAWRDSLIPVSKTSENVEIVASHIGMGVHPAALWLVANRLAQVAGEWRAFEPRGWERAVYGDPEKKSFTDLFSFKTAAN